MLCSNEVLLFSTYPLFSVTQVDQPGLLMPGRDYYLSKANESIPAIRTYLSKLAMALGAESEARVQQDVDDLLEFETTVANVSVIVKILNDSVRLSELFLD